MAVVAGTSTSLPGRIKWEKVSNFSHEEHLARQIEYFPAFLSSYRTLLVYTVLYVNFKVNQYFLMSSQYNGCNWKLPKSRLEMVHQYQVSVKLHILSGVTMTWTTTGLTLMILFLDFLRVIPIPTPTASLRHSNHCQILNKIKTFLQQ